MRSPFDRSDIVRDAGGVARYQKLVGSIGEMLRVVADRRPDHVAIIELGGPQATYRQLWERSARVAGGDRVLSDAEWGEIVRELLHGAGVAERDGPGGPRCRSPRAVSA